MGNEKSKGTLAFDALRQISTIYKLDNSLPDLEYEERAEKRTLIVKPQVEAFFA